MPPLVIPLYYQLLEAYHPIEYYSPPPSVLVENISLPTSTPTIVQSRQNYKLALIGDSMIDTLSENICQKSFVSYFPQTNFQLLKYGYGSTTIESALKRLTEMTVYLGKNYSSVLSQNPDLIVIESFAYNNYGNSESGINRYRQALSDIIKVIKTQSPKTKIVLAATIAPNSISFGNGLKDVHFSALEKIEKTSTIKLYLQNIINYGNENNLPVANAYQSSLFNQEGLESLISSGDHLHPSPLGTQLFCDTLAKTIYDNHLLIAN